MKRLVSLLLAAATAALLLCGCEPIHSPFVGTWVCQESVENYPDRLTLGNDGLGSVDECECMWECSKSKSELTLLVDTVGEYRYIYTFLNHSTMYLDDVEYQLVE